VVTNDLSTFIEREISETGADPTNLVFEITETRLMRDIEKGRSFAGVESQNLLQRRPGRFLERALERLPI